MQDLCFYALSSLTLAKDKLQSVNIYAASREELITLINSVTQQVSAASVQIATLANNQLTIQANKSDEQILADLPF